MSDEIDIEEHDLLENPTIKRIFPDLSVIKKEISEYEDSHEGLDAPVEETSIEIFVHREAKLKQIPQHVNSATRVVMESTSQTISQQISKDNQLEVHLRFKKFLDSLDDNISENDEFNTTCRETFNDNIPTSVEIKVEAGENEAIQPVKEYNILSSSSKRDSNAADNQNIQSIEVEIKSPVNNMFILGSKPSLIPPEITESKHLRVTLNNVMTYLSESKQYCEHCLILFPSVDAWKCHIDLIHTPTFNPLKNNLKSKGKVKLECEICYSTFSVKGNLDRHMKNVHKTRKTKKNKVIIDTGRSSRSNTKMSHENHKCFHCREEFESQSSLIEHLYDVLNPNKTNTNSTPLDSTKQKQTPEHSTCTGKLTEKNIDQSINNDLHDTVSANSKLNKRVKKRAKGNELTKNKEQCSNVKNSEVIEKTNSGSVSDNYSHQSDDISDNHIASATGTQTVVENSTNVIIVEKKEVYQCYICSQYMIYFKWYTSHMYSHNIKNVLEAGPVVFETKCKFCNVQNLCDVKSYNRHISQSHRKKTCSKINLDDKALQSVLFKCVKCDVSFLTANAAKNHSDHEAIFVHWKCLDCHRLFKIKDRVMHLKQHLLSKNITIYVLPPSALSRVLYKCLKCAVHFSEREYFFHYNKCDLEMTKTAYCNTCDILIKKNDMILHELNHKDKETQLIDFTFIESEIIVEEHKKKEIQNPHAASKFALTFCTICNCYLGNVGRKRKAHVEGRCGIINPRMCRICGLIFTSRGYVSHKLLHNKVKTLNLQSFYFYDIKTKRQIRPPMPKYPKCDICEVHFFGKKGIKEHLCTKQNFTTCDYCKISLTPAAFKLHVNFHKYKLSSNALSKKRSVSLENAITSTTNSNTANPKIGSSLNEVKQKSKRSVLKKKLSVGLEMEEPVTSTTSNSEAPQNVILKVSDNTLRAFLFTCIPCQITVDSYDKAVEHCHDHYDYKENLSSHKNAYIKDKSRERFETEIEFDPFYIRFQKDIWAKHIFQNLTEAHVQYVLDSSKYKFECRLKMEEIQVGSSSNVNSSTLYKCDICRSYIEPNALYSHASTSCIKTRKYPCSTCGLCFTSERYKNIHEKTHESADINPISYKTILFNKSGHEQFSQMMIGSRNKFVFYQCRNCEVTIDKLLREIHTCSKAELSKCSYCGLLFYEKDLKLHVTKHEIIKELQIASIIVIMFGKLESKRDNRLKPSFNGRIFDLKFYKCSNCGLCSESNDCISKHDCISKSYESKCPKCYLCFLPKELEEHYKLHENNLELDYDDFNSNIIIFTKSTTSVVNDCINQNEVNTESNVNHPLMENMMEKIYKCICGLHFLEEVNARKHSYNCNPRMKISKQSCFNCDLLFTPGELFDHLLKHHSNKKMRFKYNIINLTEIEEQNDK